MWGDAFGHETSYWGGAYRAGLISHWLLTLGTCPNSQVIEQQVRDNEAYTEWWAQLEANGPYGNHFVNINASSIQQAGWWDIFAQQQIDTYEGSRKYGNVTKHWFWAIPLGHCTGSLSDFDYPKAEVLDPQDQSIRLFQGNFSAEVFSYTKRYNYYVFGPVPKYVGLNATKTGNYWTSTDEWPVYTPTKWYLSPGGYLTKDTPKSGNATFTYDPLNPAPQLGGNNLFGAWTT
jgi:predicted acyl esterase